MTERETRAQYEAYERFKTQGVVPATPDSALAFTAAWMAARDYYHDLQASEEEVHLIFDGPPGPEGPRFIEAENDCGQSIAVGEWRGPQFGVWALVIPRVLRERPEPTRDV
jgi:hypothetical protein